MHNASPPCGGYDIYHEVDGRPLLKAVTLELPAGSTIGLAGPHGAGKSLLAAILAGLIRPILGDITHEAKQVAYIHDHVTQDLRLTVEEWVEYRAACSNLQATAPWRQEDPLLPLGLAALRGRRLEACSRWERLLVEIAASIASAPAAWVLDLPLADLSQTRLHLLENWLREQSTVLLIHARADVLRSRCDKVYWLEGGRLTLR